MKSRGKSINQLSAMIAFTLAEVLITLGIIGIVAAMTIPTIMNNINNQQYVTALKKVYTGFSQVLLQVTSDGGCIGDLKCTGLFDDSPTATNALGESLSSYFKVVKNCANSTSGCFSNNVSTRYDGSTVRNGTYDSTFYYRFISADGVAFSIRNYAQDGAVSANCANDYGSGNVNNTCAIVYVDVNGLNGPNNFGRDIFAFYITNGKGPVFYPEGGSDFGAPAYWGTYCSTSYSGTYCTGRIMDEGWKMTY